MAQPCLQMVTVGVRISYYEGEEPAVDHYGSEGTMKPSNAFNAESDTQALRNAMKGFGTDEKTIIDILSHRSSAQRQQIRIKYKSLFDKDLVRDLKSELSGSFERAAIALVMTPSEYDAQELRTAKKVWAHFNTLRIPNLCCC